MMDDSVLVICFLLSTTHSTIYSLTIQPTSGTGPLFLALVPRQCGEGRKGYGASLGRTFEKQCCSQRCLCDGLSPCWTDDHHLKVKFHTFNDRI